MKERIWYYCGKNLYKYGFTQITITYLLLHKRLLIAPNKLSLKNTLIHGAKQIQLVSKFNLRYCIFLYFLV